MSEKLCVFCEHLEMDTSGCHGDYPDPATWECNKKRWTPISHYGWSIESDFREQILVAKDCPDYKEAK